MASTFFKKLLLFISAFFALHVAAQDTALRRSIINTRSETQPFIPATKIQRRDETEGADCSPEGQWNCMPDTWQRCAAGRWSQVMDLAQGTICTPQGLTEEITIEHDGTVNGGDGGDDSGNEGGDTFSGGARTGVAAGFAVAAGVFALL